MWRDAIEQQFGVSVTRETRTARCLGCEEASGTAGRCCAPTARAEPGSGVAGWRLFNLVMKRPHDAPLFPLEPFAVHSVPFFYLAQWFEEWLGGQVIDETGLGGIYGFELPRTVAQPATS